MLPILQELKILNAYHAADMSRRQVQNVPKSSKNSNILEFHDHIWNHHEKCIQISTNMPGIGLEICEISRILRNKNDFVWMVKPTVACKVLTLTMRHA